MTTLFKKLALGAALAAALTSAANAHRFWIVPSSTVVSGEGQWVAFDAAISNDLFFPGYHAIGLEAISATAPDGTAVPLENAIEGHLRSAFDLKLEQEGTYKIASDTQFARASYKENGEDKFFSGPVKELFAKGIPAMNPEEMYLIHRTTETFVTLGAPTETVLAPTGKGIELVAVTHPNDLFAGEEATFKLIKNGAPIADKKLDIVAGADRYRNDTGAISVTTDAAGAFSVTWPKAGRYFFEIDLEDETVIEGVTLPVYGGFSVVLEVLPQ